MRHNAVASIWAWFIIVAAKTGGTIRAGETSREFNRLVVLARTGALGQMPGKVECGSRRNRDTSSHGHFVAAVDCVRNVFGD